VVLLPILRNSIVSLKPYLTSLLPQFPSRLCLSYTSVVAITTLRSSHASTTFVYHVRMTTTSLSSQTSSSNPHLALFFFFFDCTSSTSYSKLPVRFRTAFTTVSSQNPNPPSTPKTQRPSPPASTCHPTRHCATSLREHPVSKLTPGRIRISKRYTIASVPCAN